jgi:hypothetical protein
MLGTRYAWLGDTVGRGQGERTGRLSSTMCIHVIQEIPVSHSVLQPVRPWVPGSLIYQYLAPALGQVQGLGLGYSQNQGVDTDHQIGTQA